MNNDLNQLSRDELIHKYQDALQEIQYLEFQIHTLNEEIDLWQQAYDEHVDILVAHNLI